MVNYIFSNPNSLEIEKQLKEIGIDSNVSKKQLRKKLFKLDVFALSEKYKILSKEDEECKKSEFSKNNMPVFPELKDFTIQCISKWLQFEDFPNSKQNLTIDNNFYSVVRKVNGLINPYREWVNNCSRIEYLMNKIGSNNVKILINNESNTIMSGIKTLLDLSMDMILCSDVRKFEFMDICMPISKLQDKKSELNGKYKQKLLVLSTALDIPYKKIKVISNPNVLDKNYIGLMVYRGKLFVTEELIKSDIKTEEILDFLELRRYVLMCVCRNLKSWTTKSKKLISEIREVLIDFGINMFLDELKIKENVLEIKKFCMHEENKKFLLTQRILEIIPKQGEFLKKVRLALIKQFITQKMGAEWFNEFSKKFLEKVSNLIICDKIYFAV
jgi:hypothetical protein